MLSVWKVQRGGIGYYFETTGGDRTGLVEADGRWLGSLAGVLGVGSTVSEGDLRAILDGIDPSSGEILDPRHHRVRVVAFDAVFAAPKSASVVHALGGGEETEAVRTAHEIAVEAVVAYLEDHVALVRRSGPRGRSAVRVEGLAAAAFLHRTSRAPDPHLHSHVLIANLAVDDSDRWSALDARALFQHRRAAGALYGAELRRELAERGGLSWRSRRPGVVDLVGVSDRAIRGFSRRQEEILAEQARTGADGPSDARRIGNWTRPPKDTATPYEALVESWRERAYTLGVTSIAGARASALSPAVGDDPEAARHARVADAVVRAVESFDAPFLRRQLIASAAGGIVDGATAREVEAVADEMLASPAVDEARDLPGARMGLRDRLPPPLVEPRYVSGPAAARIEALSRALAAAPSLDDVIHPELDRGGPGGGEPVGLVVDRGGGRGPLGTLEVLTEMSAEAATTGRRVIGVAPYESLAGHLEALTGVSSVTADRVPLPRHGDLLIVFGPSRLAPTVAAGLLERAREPGVGVVFVEPPPAVSDGAPRRAATPGRSPETGLVVAQTPGGTVVLAPGVRAIPAVVAGARRDAVERGLRPVVVAAERGLRGELGGDVHAPGEGMRLATRPEVELIVVGGARVLPSDRGRGTSTRSFVGVVPRGLAPDDAGRFAAALASVRGRATDRDEPRLGRGGRGRADDIGIGRH